MPQLVKLQDELKDTGFTIVSPHAQQGTREDALKLMRKFKVNYTVVSQGEVPVKKPGTIPFAVLIDSQGKIVDKGGNISHKTIADLVNTEPHFLAAGRKYTKLKGVADSLKKSKAYGQILKKLDKDLKGTGATTEEAKYLAERIVAYGTKKLDGAKANETDDAFLANQTYSEVAANWKGHELGEKASTRLKELKADKAFQEELKASTLYHQILAECEKLIAPQGKIILDSGPNQRVAATITASAIALKKRYPNSKATSKVQSELAGYGFKGL